HGNAAGRAIDDVVGDHRAFEGEFGIKRHLAAAGAIVADDLHIVSGIGADGGEGAPHQHIVGNKHIAGTEHIDAIAVLAGATAIGADILDAVPLTMVPSGPCASRKIRMPPLPQSPI
ncbi:hypothetical protein LJD47_27715, partial [Escherichia coli]|nr:hypothetical protein [Escherichia coli]